MRLTLIFTESAFSYNLPLEVRVDLVLCLVLLGLVLVIGALNSFNNICIKTNSANFNSPIRLRAWNFDCYLNAH